MGSPDLPGEVLVSQETSDDAAVYRLPDGRLLVQTVDFFTPIVDDPYDWGRIAAANAMSDVYAMGARPVLALNLVAWPVDDLPLELLTRVLQGGAAVAREAGMSIVGGHSITDSEPKYGMSVTGFASEETLVRNSTAPAGAALYLTKPLGLGIISTAIKRGLATQDQVERAVGVMTELNAAAAEAMADAQVDAATDVTGFGLLGHLRSMLAASGAGASLDASAIPFLSGALDLARRGVVPSGTERNHAFVSESVSWGETSLPEQLALADAQTSGGLLIATRREEELEDALRARGIPVHRVGVVTDGPVGHIAVSGRILDPDGD
jgi:selenide,water dikinase